MAENQLYDLLEVINRNLNAIVLNQAHIYAELEEIKQEIKEQSTE